MMAEVLPKTEDGDPTTGPYWAAARKHQLVVQRCAVCGGAQLYPRPFCLACGSDTLRWEPVCGTGTIYSKTTVEVRVLAELDPPYTVALVELDEGPRLLAHLRQQGSIGERVHLFWQSASNLSKLPVLIAVSSEAA
jgi:uncharacterized OB-fold protein